MDFESALQAHEQSTTLQSYIRRLYKLQDIDPDLRDAADDWLSSEIAQIEIEMKNATVQGGKSVEFKNIIIPSVPQWHDPINE